jgi:hypothetical protein
LAEDGLYLQPEAAYAEAQKLGSASGNVIGIAASTLWRRMHERKLLLSTERTSKELRLRARKTIGGSREPIIHIAHLDPPSCEKPGQPGQSFQEERGFLVTLLLRCSCAVFSRDVPLVPLTLGQKWHIASIWSLLRRRQTFNDIRSNIGASPWD